MPAKGEGVVRKILPPQIRKWAVRLLKIGVVAVACILAIQVLVLPRVVRYAAARALAGLGLSDARFDVRGVSFFDANLIDLTIGSMQQDRVGSIAVDYTPASLLAGRITAIRVTGAELRVGYHGGKLDLGSIAAFLNSKSTGARPPFDRLDLRASTLVIDWEGRRLWIPAEGAITTDQAGALHILIIARLQGTPCKISGMVDPATGRIEAAVDAIGLDTGALGAALPADLAGYIPALGRGILDFHATFAQVPEGRTLSVSASAQKWRLSGDVQNHRVVAADLSWSATARLDGNLNNVTEATFELAAKRIMFDTEAARDVSLTVRKLGDDLVVNAAGSGNYWKIRKLEARVSGLFPPDLAAAPKVVADFAVDGSLPPKIVDLLEARGLDVRTLGPLSASGKLAGQLHKPAPDAPGAPRSWEAAAEDVRLSIAPGDIALGNGQTALRGLSGDFHLSARATETGSLVSILPGSSLSVQSIESAAMPLAIEKSDSSRPVISAAIDAQPAQFKLALGGAQDNSASDPWTFSVPRLVVNLPPAGITVGQGAARIDALTGSLALRAEASPRLIQAFALDGSTIDFKSITTRAEQDGVQIGPWKLALSNDGNQPLFRLVNDPENAPARASVVVNASTPLTIKHPAFQGSAKKFGIRAAATFASGQPPAIEGELSIDEASATYPAADVSVGRFTANIPFTWNTAPRPSGKFEVSAIRRGKTQFPPVSGTLALDRLRADFDAQWPFIENLARLNLTGWADLSGDSPAAFVHAEIPPFELKDPATIARLVPQTAGTSITGAFEASADIRLANSRLSPLIELKMHDVNVVDKEMGRSVTGIAGGVVLDSFEPLSTRGGQEIRIAKAEIGKLVFTNGVFTFRVEDVDKFHLEGMKWDFCDGAIYARSFRLDLKDPRIVVDLSADHLSLVKLLPLFVEGDATGEGELYGHLPVSLSWPVVEEKGQRVVRWSEPLPRIPEGFIYATPGGGFLSIPQAETYVGQLLEKQDPEFAKGGKREREKQSLVAGLRDLKYTVLKFDIQKPDGKRAILDVAGQKRDGTGPPIGWTMNINGFDSALILAVYGKQVIDRLTNQQGIEELMKFLEQHAK